jgi:histidine ammonia-lyase
MRNLLDGSEIIANATHGRVQDAYSLRCIPQIHGATRDALAYVKKAVETEINAVTDNPILFVKEGEVISGGNFHGQPMALAFDFLGIAVAELANIAERRIERLVNPALSGGLPAFLSANGGLNSGFMICQYCAASLVSENKILASPACVDSIPSSANQEDHVSMGTIAARKAQSIVENTRSVLAIELLCAAQGIDMRGGGQLAQGSKAAYQAVRKEIAYLDEDRELRLDIEKAQQLIKEETVLTAVYKAIGSIH